MGVKIKLKFDGFHRDDEGVADYHICTDEQRLQ